MERLTRLFDADWIAGELLVLTPRLLLALLVLVAFRVAFRLTRIPLRALLVRWGLDEALVGMLVDKVYHYALAAVAIVTAADQLGLEVRPALAGLGIVGLAVGLAAQDSIANVIAGFLIFLDKPFLVGDWVRVADLYGRVFEITLRTTRIRTRANTYVVIPNKKIIDEVLVNYSKHGSTRVGIPIGIAYKESIPAAREALLRVAEGAPEILDAPAPEVVVMGCGTSSVDLELRVWVDDAEQERPVFHQLIERSKRALDEAGIQIPYPHLQLFLDRVDEGVWARLADLLQAPRPGGGAAGR